MDSTIETAPGGLCGGDAESAAISDAIQLVLRSAVGDGTWTLVDLGGGTGGFAVPLARLGHQVLVVDPSPDARAALERRAADAGVGDRIHAELADATELGSLVEAGSIDGVLCHGVLEIVEDPAAALRAICCALRRGGVLSVVAHQYRHLVLSRAMSGRFGDANAALRDPDGRWSDADSMLHRFDEPRLRGLLHNSGFAIAATHGVGPIAGLVPAQLATADPHAARELSRLDERAAVDPVLRAIAPKLHVLAINDSAPAAPTVEGRRDRSAE